MRHLNHIDLAVAVLINLPEPLAEVSLRYHLFVGIITHVQVQKVFSLNFIQEAVPIHPVVLPDLLYESQDLLAFIFLSQTLLKLRCQ